MWVTLADTRPLIERGEARQLVDAIDCKSRPLLDDRSARETALARLSRHRRSGMQGSPVRPSSLPMQ